MADFKPAYSSSKVTMHSCITASSTSIRQIQTGNEFQTGNSRLKKPECSKFHAAVRFQTSKLTSKTSKRASNAPAPASHPKAKVSHTRVFTQQPTTLNLCSIKDQQQIISQDTSRAAQTEAAHHSTVAANAMPGHE
ncbi:hypothetical protein Nepgr_031337 [Nepenthes gracilis]|uniref:Uncharacterized protein n=1 Tax=Nepenthes gracilis TaxID=150966 RepID=A0AAD3TI37_NEPGR|nr:hypothetical protein Nepgr_031337 [Nepenthes gracilis]